MSRIEMEKIIEAALFMSPNSISLQSLKDVAGVSSLSETKNLVLDLMNWFNKKNSSLEIIELEKDIFQMKVKEEYIDFVNHLGSDSKFSKSSMKTLALIAFKQPILQKDVVNIRNNRAYDHISELVDSGFVKKTRNGNSYFLSTTPKFVAYFGKDFSKKKVE